MGKDWVKIFASVDVQLVEIMRSLLDENSIISVVLNQKDSMYNAFGDVELYVHRDFVVQAKHLINPLIA